MARKPAAVIIYVGAARSGKDTTESFMDIHLEKEFPNIALLTLSTIQPVNDMLDLISYPHRDKTEETRQVQSAIKDILDKDTMYLSSIVFERAGNNIAQYLHRDPMSDAVVQTLHVREQKGIDFFKEQFGKAGIPVIVVKVSRKEAEKNCPDVRSDKEAMTIKGDFTIKNNGTLGELMDATGKVAKEIITLMKFQATN